MCILMETICLSKKSSDQKSQNIFKITKKNVFVYYHICNSICYNYFLVSYQINRPLQRLKTQHIYKALVIYIDFESCIVCSGVLVALPVHTVYTKKQFEFKYFRFSPCNEVASIINTSRLCSLKKELPYHR
jgi:hypothetical protein